MKDRKILNQHLTLGGIRPDKFECYFPHPWTNILITGNPTPQGLLINPHLYDPQKNPDQEFQQNSVNHNL